MTGTVALIKPDKRLCRTRIFTEDLEREGIVPRTGKRNGKSYKENENTEVDIIDTKRAINKQKAK